MLYITDISAQAQHSITMQRSGINAALYQSNSTAAR
jgi:hypothetical protein